MKILIGYGLPASGKTTFLSTLKRTNNSYINFDFLTRLKKEKDLTVDQILERNSDILCFYNSKGIYIIDGLFTTNNDIIKLFNVIKKVNRNLDIEEIIIYEWNEDRESCLWNDKYRRCESCESSIKLLPYEKVDVELLEKEIGYKVQVEEKKVQRKSIYEYEANKLLGISLKENNFLYSDKWITGGTYCDCWGGTSSAYPEEPVEFELLDVFLEKKIPNLSFLQYKKIMRECVSVDTVSEGDYYGGCVYYNFYKCNMEKLYKILDEIKSR